MARLIPIAACLLLLAVVSITSQAPPASPADDALRAELTATAERIVLPERCGECHAAEFEVWDGTEHATGFDTLHRRDRAKEIYRSLGLRVIKRGTDETTPACLSCHYTPVLRRGGLRAGAGVTCESCHGPARDWVSVHNSYGVAEADFQRAARLETAGHRAQRIADSRAAGMRRPSDLYDVAANCFGCHTVPNEQLVNRGGHSTGSDFEFVAWSERIRHNFLESYKTADGRTNAERPRARKRTMYVVGRALDLEYALRGVAAATDPDELYLAAMSDRAVAALDELVAIDERVALPAVQRMIAVWNAVDVLGDDGGRLLAAAEAVRESTRQFIAAAPGATLAALDPLWDPEAPSSAPSARLTEVSVAPVALPPAGEDHGAGRAADAASPAVGRAPSFAAPVLPPAALRVPDIAARVDTGVRRDFGAPLAAAPPPAAPPPAAPPPVAPPAAAPADAAPPRRIATLLRPPWREPPAHAFVKVPCGRCHTSQERWWRKDPHSRAAKPFHGNEPRNLEIAAAYGVDAADMARGNQTCMWCHGTPVSAPGRRVRAGVGCQRCHGAGADYVEPHETVGYDASVALGMMDLRNPAIQAATCAGCHYITDPGLIDAGHPAGADFDVRLRADGIVHWGADFGRTTVPADRDALVAAYAGVVADRGPVPVPRPAPVRAPSPPEPGAGEASVPVRAPSPSEPAAGEASAPAPGAPAGSRVAASSRPAPASPTLVRVARPPRSGAALRSGRRGSRPGARPAPVPDPGLEAFRPDPGASVEETLAALRTRIESLYRELQG